MQVCEALWPFKNLSGGGGAKRRERRQRRRNRPGTLPVLARQETASLSLGISRCALDEVHATPARDDRRSARCRSSGTGVFHECQVCGSATGNALGAHGQGLDGGLLTLAVLSTPGRCRRLMLLAAGWVAEWIARSCLSETWV